MKRARREVRCECPRCLGVATADPRYGYDRAKVPGVKCLHCGQPIGDLPYREVIMLARFGSMQFTHEKCPPVDTPAVAES